MYYCIYGKAPKVTRNWWLGIGKFIVGQQTLEGSNNFTHAMLIVKARYYLHYARLHSITVLTAKYSDNCSTEIIN